MNRLAMPFNVDIGVHSAQSEQMRSTLAVVLGLTAACGCHQKRCKDVALEGLNVNVVDRFGAAICDVTIEIRDGSHVEATTLTPSQCSFSGAIERAGTYTVRAFRQSTVVATQTVVVASDECHVKQTAVTLMQK